MPQLQAGIATVDITPYVGVWLAGFGSRNKPSQGLHDPLRARVLVLDDGDTRLALITNDILSLTYETLDELKAMIHQECDLPPERVMINCSHTHSGPVTRPAGELYVADDCYIRLYARKVLGAVKMAIADLAPARIGAARTDVQIGINRRERTPDGSTKLGRNPDLPVAPYVDVFRINSEQGDPRVILFSHACHPVTMGGSSYLISADYPGRAQAVVEAVFPGAQAMFAQGCSGNINSEPVNGAFEDVHRLGSALGGAVIKAAAMIDTDSDVTLRSAFEPFEIPLQDPPPFESAKAQLEAEQENLVQAEEGGDETRIRAQKGTVNWAERVLKLAEDGATDLTMRYDLQAFAINDRAIIGLPGEVFVEFQLNIDAGSPFEQTTVLGVTNGCPSYVPIADEYQYGGYEVESAIRYYGTTMLDPKSEQVILQGAQDLLNRLNK